MEYAAERSPFMTDSKANLIQKACRGDLAAYQECIRQYSPRVHAIAFQMVGNSIDAQDIAQEVFLRLFRSLRTYRSEYRFTTWLYRLTTNLSIDYLRRHSRHRNVPLEEIASVLNRNDSVSPQEKTLERSELKTTIQEIAEGLTRNQRRVFVLRELQGFSTSEVAQILKCRESTVRVHLAKAREHIRNQLHYKDDHEVPKS
jgi:RNA polymerase sigma-70 factor (ECF subfamily)